jgi:hypothetical protein
MTTINILQHQNCTLATTSPTYVSLTVHRHSFVDTTLVEYIMGKEARAGHNFLPRIQKVLIPYQVKI